MIHQFKMHGFNIVLDVNSGSVHAVDDVAYDILACSDDLSMYQQKDIDEAKFEIEQLKSQGLLFSPEQIIEKCEPVIKALCLHVSHKCNLKCKYCFAQEGSYGGDDLLMSEEVGLRAIDFLVENSGNRNNLEVDFFGGEPLMNFDVVKQIVEYGKRQTKNIRFTMTTNGILLDDEIIEYLNENMFNIVLSIDGRKNITDMMRSNSYDKILPLYKKLVSLREDKFYYMRGTFTRHNLDFANDVIHLAEQGFEQISIEPVVAEDCDYAIREEDLPTVYAEYERLAKIILEGKYHFNFFHFMMDLENGPCIAKRSMGCGAGCEYLAVTPTGNLYPCHQFVNDEDFLLGNVKKLNSNLISNDVNSKESCKTCWAKYFCGGGCIANAFMFNRDLHKPYEIGCALQRKRIECALMLKVAKSYAAY